MNEETSVTPYYQTAQYQLPSDPDFKSRILSYISQHSSVHCFLDSNQYTLDHQHQYEWIAACSPINVLQIDQSSKSELLHLQLKEFLVPGAWYLGVLGYDIKNNLESLFSRNPDPIDAPEMVFFEAGEVITLRNDQITIYSTKSPEKVWEDILQFQRISNDSNTELTVIPEPQITKEKYLSQINRIRKHILDGDIYELNFCQSFVANYEQIDTASLFESMSSKTKAPFAAYFQYKEYLVMSSSPERFLQKVDTQLISQPIKGTISKSPDPQQDLIQKKELIDSEKNRAENVMIVDLVRNDLSRSCKPGTVKVDELFGIYSFEKVHHLISTVSGELKEEMHWVDALLYCFPMGSMTGAPKVKSMELIEELESFKRGWYSGAIGYVSPESNFDFSVIIRSLVFNTKKKKLVLAVGGAIVHDSEAEQEYEESLLKAKSLFELLNKEAEM
jgi:para-aminobenzoate synthetase component 1